MKSKICKIIKMHILPLRDIVIYPYMVIPLFVGRKNSIKCIEKALKKDKKIMLITQKKNSINDPKKEDLFKIGIIASILQILKLPDGTVKILVEGKKRAKIINFYLEKKIYLGEIKIISSKKIQKKENLILKRTLLNQFEKYSQLNKKISLDIMTSLQKIKSIEQLTDTIAIHIVSNLIDKQKILETIDIKKRLDHLMTMLESEIKIFKIEKKIRNRIKKQMEKNQKEYYLNEQMKAIQIELGKEDPDIYEYSELKKKILSSDMPKNIEKIVIKELKRLKLMPYMSSETTVVRNYIDWMIKIPWNKRTQIKKNLTHALLKLNTDHYGIKKVKDRILEHLAVQNRKNKIKGPILCLIGPPGVGKTSLGKSIADATGRKYIRMSLGGIKDEAEIRGHRRTYIGSMPGKIIQNISKTKVKNPLFLLDEIDKMSYESRSDASSALLEVLDPEQNFSFNDHYLEVDYDLSEVMFVATANSFNIPIPLLERMEIIQLYGYTEDEKIHIYESYLKPKKIKENGLKETEISITKPALIDIIRYYTKEAGVRNLEKKISKIYRKAVKEILLNKKIKKIHINRKNLEKYLGIKKINPKKINKKNQIGQVTGLAWTSCGGETLEIQTACVFGKGKLSFTGCLGKVMKESIQTALTVIRTQAKKLNIPLNFYEKNDIHVHIPEGSTPKDGPSAGISICTSLTSSLTKNPVKSNFAMTGEITLNGNILSIGGLKEKILAAHREGIKNIIIPKENQKNLKEIPRKILSNIKIYLVKNIQEVLKLSLTKNPYK
ncbi:endopeptidase La [Buchnera aphidicola]|uniref:endopeptidase La n=1 Tax=Buchnera aphidicola TaxID=9 RepID=UPI0020927ED5|nr:endopeptidase La [Buchnera aphidicola]USS94045.1 endopeptidase La [Buchnera aphidicola (Sipha maydis)]WII23589.1 endopeptidase La [Buchnera aphidicola (Sipha maydis)]